MDTIIVYIFN